MVFSPANLYHGIAAIDGIVYFTARDGVHGRELWRTDGTSSGTSMVKDIRPGRARSNLYYLLNVGGVLYFSRGRRTRYGSELWKSDGTRTGTVMVRDITPGPALSVSGFLAGAGNHVFFGADDGIHGAQLWTSDGTAAGTIRLTRLIPGSGGYGPESLTAAGDEVYFWTCGRRQCSVWKSDGTPTGTPLVPVLHLPTMTRMGRWRRRPAARSSSLLRTKPTVPSCGGATARAQVPTL